MLITLHVVDTPPPPIECFSNLLYNLAHRYETSRRSVPAQNALGYAEQAYTLLKSWRQPVSPMKSSKFLTYLILFTQSYVECLYMSKRATKPLAQSVPGNLVFVNFRLSPEQLAEYDDLKITPAQVMSTLTATLMEGYRFSCSYNPEKKQANAMIVNVQADSPAFNHALSAFSGDCADAVKLVLYKHVHLLGGDWTALLQPSEQRSNRG